MQDRTAIAVPPLLQAAMDAGSKVADLRAALALAEEEQARAVRAWEAACAR